MFIVGEYVGVFCIIKSPGLLRVELLQSHIPFYRVSPDGRTIKVASDGLQVARLTDSLWYRNDAYGEANIIIGVAETGAWYASNACFLEE